MGSRRRRRQVQRVVRQFGECLAVPFDSLVIRNSLEKNFLSNCFVATACGGSVSSSVSVLILFPASIPT